MKEVRAPEKLRIKVIDKKLPINIEVAITRDKTTSMTSRGFSRVKA